MVAEWSRGLGSGGGTVVRAAWFVLRDHRRGELELRRSRERCRGLL